MHCKESYLCVFVVVPFHLQDRQQHLTLFENHIIGTNTNLSGAFMSEIIGNSTIVPSGRRSKTPNYSSVHEEMMLRVHGESSAGWKEHAPANLPGIPGRSRKISLSKSVTPRALRSQYSHVLVVNV